MSIIITANKNIYGIVKKQIQRNEWILELDEIHGFTERFSKINYNSIIKTLVNEIYNEVNFIRNECVSEKLR